MSIEDFHTIRPNHDIAIIIHDSQGIPKSRGTGWLNLSPNVGQDTVDLTMEVTGFPTISMTAEYKQEGGEENLEYIKGEKDILGITYKIFGYHNDAPLPTKEWNVFFGSIKIIDPSIRPQDEDTGTWGGGTNGA